MAAVVPVYVAADMQQQLFQHCVVHLRRFDRRCCKPHVEIASLPPAMLYWLAAVVPALQAIWEFLMSTEAGT